MPDDTAGAQPREQLLEACRRNNTDLLEDLLSQAESKSIATFLNNTTDPLGSSPLHVAAQYGSYEVLDIILDQEGVEIDGREKREGDTCLHRAVRFCNGLPTIEAASEEGLAVVEILLDAGCDPRIRNKAKLRPFDLVDPRNTVVRSALQKAEMTIVAGDDIIDEDDDDDNHNRNDAGSESD